MRWFLWLTFLLAASVAITDRTLPTGNTDQRHFDTLLVLGSPAMWDGAASPEERVRVLEAVREFQAGRAEHLIMSGGAAYNEWVEAMAMRRVAMSAGVPASAIEVEGRSLNTIQNIYYSQLIMRRHGWRSVEVVSSPEHLPRAGLILSHWDLLWHTHASSQPEEFSFIRITRGEIREAGGTALLRWFGFARTPFLPGSGRHWPGQPASQAR